MPFFPSAITSTFGSGIFAARRIRFRLVAFDRHGRPSGVNKSNSSERAEPSLPRISTFIATFSEARSLKLMVTLFGRQLLRHWQLCDVDSPSAQQWRMSLPSDQRTVPIELRQRIAARGIFICQTMQSYADVGNGLNFGNACGWAAAQ